MNIQRTGSVKQRRTLVEQHLKLPLVHIGVSSLDEAIASTRHCEQMIGVTHVPLGIAGPLRIQKKMVYIPLATTEGALVASVNRGCKAITESGGATTDSDLVGSTRGPVFSVRSLQDYRRLTKFVNTHMAQLNRIAKTTSHHIELLSVDSHGVGQYCYLRFVFDTHDAMGLNMVTIATDAITRFIEKQTGCVCIALSGNVCVDKKPSWLNVIEGRGMKVWAEVVVPNKVLQTTLKTSAQKVYDVWLSKCMMGSAMSGSMGYNAQFANVLAALFLATGQDIAHVGECSVGITSAQIRGNDLYLSVYLPDLMVGTVGGGTELETQKEALQILGVCGGDEGKNKQRFAEYIAGAVLAGELSLLASLSTNTLAKAHQTLGRGIPS